MSSIVDLATKTGNTEIKLQSSTTKLFQVEDATLANIDAKTFSSSTSAFGINKRSLTSTKNSDFLQSSLPLSPKMPKTTSNLEMVDSYDAVDNDDASFPEKYYFSNRSRNAKFGQQLTNGNDTLELDTSQNSDYMPIKKVS